jgi:hypothetical protein
MTAPDSLPLHALAEDNLAAASPDLLRTMVKTFADALMSAEADALCNAEYGQVSEERVNHRNGYRPREWDTRAGTVEPRHPQAQVRQLLPALATGTTTPGRAGPQAQGRGGDRLFVHPGLGIRWRSGWRAAARPRG